MYLDMKTMNKSAENSMYLLKYNLGFIKGKRLFLVSYWFPKIRY